MKVILSRKGFDSQYGGHASPILPNGTLLPIPQDGTVKLLRFQIEFSPIMRYLILFLLTTMLAQSVNGQLNDHDIRQEVLDKGIVDSSFIYGKWTRSGQTETHLKFLGEVSTTDGRVFKIMNSSWFWGLSRRATNRILIYDDKNQYVGHYSVGMTYELPDKLENGYLIFTNSENSDCDKKLITNINFTSSLPQEIFIKCQGEFGNCYSFLNEY